MIFWAILQNIYIEVGAAVVDFWATLKKLWLLISLYSGHTARNVLKADDGCPKAN